MKAWLRDDRVYQAIMNGALWIVVIAALSTTKWPELSWLTGSITVVLVVIVATVYWIAVVINVNHNGEPDSAAQRRSTQLTEQEAQSERKVAEERPSPHQQEALQTAVDSSHFPLVPQVMPHLRAGPFAPLTKPGSGKVAMRSEIYELLHRRLAQINKDQPGIMWTSNFDEEIMVRNWLGHFPHHGGELRSMKPHRRADTTHTLVRIAAGEEETSEKVVVMVGSVRIEIQEDDPNKTTNVHITSPKTVVTNVTDTAEGSQQKPEEYGPRRPTTTIH
jgi:hypothetical protein